MIPRAVKRFTLVFLGLMLVGGVVAGLSRDPAPSMRCRGDIYTCQVRP